MVMFNVYKEYLTRKYHTHLCSFTTCFYLAVGIITYLSPLLIAYYTLGFWLKESTYREQPEVNFKHDLIIVLQGVSPLSAYSTFSNFNALLGNNLKIPTIKSIEVDENRDGKKDYLDLNIEMPLGIGEDVNSLQLILFFDVRLHTHSSVRFESLAYISFDSGLPGSAFYTDGDLTLKQKVPLPHKGSVTKFNTRIVPDTLSTADALRIHSLLRSYQSRNLTTDFIGRYPVWMAGKSGGSNFLIKTRIYYPEQTIIYRPGFWQLIKHAWIQYLAILFIFIFVFGHVKTFVYENQLINTVVKKTHVD